MKITCYKCNHTWDYKGNSNHYICCPECYNKISLRKIAKYTKENYILPTKKLHTNNYKIIENENKDKLMIFKDGLQVLIPRQKILMQMLEKESNKDF